ncbi:2,3-diaminopropionate biosynthesis protein SbnB [Taibaiella chishuiensis]|uniref:Ornithine cyclodeaminase n=1 Tax=Taibaiella chishuiensis TaxID=1434707 RepID=A0A2P8CX55_9BACT|nr:2,3-diaminopropionate biosynthesis protein SbnB [Taibaiella chishuiensis]PSK89555.1 ornithine cyclodeaminase [Taibaiella chishuiensis]
MIYINEKIITETPIQWAEVFDQIELATATLHAGDFSQPVKPYLRYGNPKNRIIAMPAFLGGRHNVSGIKWIASFPGNIDSGLPRAHSVIVLNEAETGKPLSVINTARISGIRTAGVSGTLIRKYIDALPAGKKLVFGIIGLGPIGQLHLDMVLNAFADHIEKVVVYDLRNNLYEQYGADPRIEYAAGWEEVFDQSDVFMTCTVSDHRYIGKKPLKPSLHLNVSLRDYESSFLQFVDTMVVDDWEEICRENTDIEMMHKNEGLQESDVHTIADVICGGLFGADVAEQVIMFNPMGMAIFDMAVAGYFLQRVKELNTGVLLED